MNSTPAPGAAVSAADDDPQNQLDAFIKQVGARVLEARQAAGLSRRVLSELSGVSQRTIVLLETGAGNISIALLFRVSRALGYSVEQFVQQPDPQQQQARQLAAFFLQASQAQQQQLLTLMTAADPQALKARRLCLIGLRGAGKSTLGGRLSDALQLPFVELNREIETLSGMSVQSLMGLYGPEGYRRLERQAVEKIIESRDTVVLAAAGGIVSAPDTWSQVQRSFHTVWLKASPTEHMDRVRRQGDERPMAGNPEAMEELKSILTSRESLYSAADAMVDTSQQTVAQSLRDLLDVIEPLLATQE